MCCALPISGALVIYIWMSWPIGLGEKCNKEKEYKLSFQGINYVPDLKYYPSKTHFGGVFSCTQFMLTHSFIHSLFTVYQVLIWPPEIDSNEQNREIHFSYGKSWWYPLKASISKIY